jgi:hypothetical protein
MVPNVQQKTPEVGGRDLHQGVRSPRGMRDYQDLSLQNMDRIRGFRRKAENEPRQRTYKVPGVTLGEALEQSNVERKVQQRLLVEETKQQTFLIVTGSLTLASTLAFNQLAVHVVDEIGGERKILVQFLYTLGMMVITILIAVFLKVYWLN